MFTQSNRLSARIITIWSNFRIASLDANLESEKYAIAHLPGQEQIGIERCWSRGMILAFQADDPGSSPGQRIFLSSVICSKLALSRRILVGDDD